MAHSYLNIDLLLYAAILLVVSGMALLKPRSDFDEVFYTGLVYLNHDLSFETVHQRIYTAVRQDTPTDKQSYFLSENAFRRDLAGDATHFSPNVPVLQR